MPPQDTRRYQGMQRLLEKQISKAESYRLEWEHIVKQQHVLLYDCTEQDMLDGIFGLPAKATRPHSIYNPSGRNPRRRVQTVKMQAKQ